MKVIIWDFDGVLIDSNSIRDDGFEIVLAQFPKNQIGRLIEYHHENGGLSRYVKFRYFFEEIRGERISDDEVRKWSSAFSEVMLKRLCDTKLLIKDSLDFVRANKDKYQMYIASGSDQTELRYLCKYLDIDNLFRSIHGSPKPKIEIVSQIIRNNKYDTSECILIGDSQNDLEAAFNNGIEFYGYNNLSLRRTGVNYIDSFIKFSQCNFDQL